MNLLCRICVILIAAFLLASCGNETAVENELSEAEILPILNLKIKPDFEYQLRDIGSAGRTCSECRSGVQ